LPFLSATRYTHFFHFNWEGFRGSG
jgi:hypothetical protein